MNSLASDIRALIARRVEAAPASYILSIASNLCAAEILPSLNPAPLDTGERFALIGDDIVADRTTGLSWSRGNVGTEPMIWSAGANVCKVLYLGGFTDWRLPTVRELLTLVDYERHEPAIDPIFRCVPSYYWTSTPAACSPGDYAWLVGFGDGYSDWYGRRGVYHVHAVRSSQ